MPVLIAGTGTYLVVIVLLALYFVPTIIAFARGVVHAPVIFILNLMFGWTVIVWVITLIWACAARSRARFLADVAAHRARMEVAVAENRAALEADAASNLPSAPTADSVASELERLADLHAGGALSDEQFEAAKTRLLEL